MEAGVSGEGPGVSEREGTLINEGVFSGDELAELSVFDESSTCG